MPRNVGVMLFLALAVCGCGGGAPEGADLGADAQVDSAAPPDDVGPDAGDAGEPLDDAGADAGGEACGGTTCGADEHCCALCAGDADDVCVPNWYVGCPVADDFDCQPHDCTPDTDPSGAAVGDCDAILGYWWNGTDCRSLSGCSCSGAACAGLLATEEACRAAHSGCFICRTIAGIPCGEGEYCRMRGLLAPCGPIIPDQHGTCVPIPTSCDAVSEPVCACDGMTYDNPCLARAAQQTLEHRGACAP
jgi:hypothetical protein